MIPYYEEDVPPPTDDDVPAFAEPSHPISDSEPDIVPNTALDRATTRAADLSLIPINRLEPFKVIEAGWKAIEDANRSPWVFRRGSHIVLIGEQADGTPTMEPCGTPEVQGILLRVARWVRMRDGGMTPVEPPRMVAADMVAFPSKTLPQLDAVTRSPVFDATTGRPRLVNRPGYDPKSRLLYSPARDFMEPFVPDRPTDRQVATALDLLLHRWLGDFPFESPADRTHALALALLPSVRRLIRGPTPLHLAEAAERGTGKSLLVKLALAPSLGTLPEPATYSRDPEEVRKKITSLLLAGRRAVFLDNLEGQIDSPDLAAVLTSERWEDRVLGASTMTQLPNEAVWAASGNNCELSTDIARRTVRFRLNRNMERPWEWKGARIKNIETWTMENRRHLLGAILTLIQSWVAAGAKLSDHHLGSFESWAATIGGILTHLEQPGFLSNLNQMYEQADTSQTEWRAFVLQWWNERGTDACSAGTLADIADGNGMLASVLGSANSERAKAIRVGRALTKQRDRVISGLKMTMRTEHNQTVYALVAVEGAPPREKPAPRRPAYSGYPPPPTDDDR